MKWNVDHIDVNISSGLRELSWRFGGKLSTWLSFVEHFYKLFCSGTTNCGKISTKYLSTWLIVRRADYCCLQPSLALSFLFFFSNDDDLLCPWTGMYGRGSSSSSSYSAITSETIRQVDRMMATRRWNVGYLSVVSPNEVTSTFKILVMYKY